MCMVGRGTLLMLLASEWHVTAMEPATYDSCLDGFSDPPRRMMQSLITATMLVSFVLVPGTPASLTLCSWV